MIKKLDDVRMFSLVFHSMIGIRLITMPLSTVKYAKNDGWLCAVVVGIIILITAKQGFWICKKYPELDFAQINERLYGKVLGKILLIAIIAYNIYTNGVSLRLFSESINLLLLERTPMVIIMLIALSLMCYCALMDLETISIVFDVLLPMVLFFIILLALISITAVTPFNLYPPLHRGVVPIIKGVINSLSPATASFIFAFILPMFKNPQATKKYVNSAIIVGTVIYTVIVALCIMVFGAEEINYLLLPTLTLSKAIQLENEVFERTESLFMAAWIPNTITSFVVNFLISSICAKALFNTKRDVLVKVSQLPFIFIIALIPKSNAEIFKMLEFGNLGVIALILIYVPMTTLTVFIKKGRGKKC